jgi:flagellar basal-body rod protein FlgB
MFDTLELSAMAQARMAHAGQRLAAVAENVAQADTPGFRPVRTQDFAAFWADRQGAGDLRQTRAGHLAATPMLPADRLGTEPNGNAVSLEDQMLAAVDARQGHEMALSIWRATSDVLRTSLGRR